LVCVVAHEDSTRIHLRRLEEVASTPLTGTEGGYSPFFSPDGRWIGFFAGDKLKKLAIEGGAPLVLCDTGSYPMGGSWGEDGRIVFSTGAGVSLRRVADGGGEVETLANRDIIQGLVIWPQVLRGGRAILLTLWSPTSPDYWTLTVYLPETGEFRTLLEGGTFGRVLPTGHLAFVRGSTIHAVAFDAERLAVSGDPVPLVDGVRTEELGAAQFSYAESGSLAYIPGYIGRMAELVWVDPAGEVESLGFRPEYFATLRLSPDGRLLAADIAEAKGEIWIYDLQLGTRRRLAGDRYSASAVWTPDGREVWYFSDRDGNRALYRTPVDGSAEPRKVELEEGIYPWWPDCISPDGRTLVFLSTYPGDLMLLDIESGGVHPFPATSAWGAAISPDGRWIAYTSEATGRPEVEVQPFPDGGRTWTVSSGSGEEPLWSPKGNRMFYRWGDSWMAVDFTTEPEFSPRTPQLLFKTPALDAGMIEYAVDPSGERFLIPRTLEDANESAVLHLILNWDTELSRLAPIEQ